jgi:CBS domain containing-hemolysin-like protein
MVGMVLVKDLLSRTIAQKSNSVTAKDLMREVLFAPESKSIMGVFKDLKRTKNHMAIIIDEYGGTAGLVTMEDILEEIVGEIQDEFDTEDAKILQVSDYTYDVSGSLNLDDFFDFFKLKEEDVLENNQDVDTLAGWVTQIIGQLPKVGQHVEVSGLNLEVKEVKHRRIHMIRVKILEPKASQFI